MGIDELVNLAEITPAALVIGRGFGPPRGGANLKSEPQWLTCSDPRGMLNYLRGRASDRKLRLFAIACCRKIARLLTDTRSSPALVTTERFAESLAILEELSNANNDANSVHVEVEDDLNGRETAAEAVLAACWVPDIEDGLLSVKGIVVNVLLFLFPDLITLSKPFQIEQRRLCGLIREESDNLFRQVVVDPAWCTSRGVALEKEMYDDRAFGRMAELAAALGEAGCQDQNILAHCRQPEHVRGCWVLDLLLGKKLIAFPLERVREKGHNTPVREGRKSVRRASRCGKGFCSPDGLSPFPSSSERGMDRKYQALTGNLPAH